MSKTDHRYVISTKDGRVYAIEYDQGWIPTRALGPFAGAELSTEPADLHWSDARPARWNAATLIRLCPAERARMIAGADPTRSKRVIARNRQELPGRGLTDVPHMRLGTSLTEDVDGDGSDRSE